MDSNVRLGDGVLDEAKSEINSRATELVKQSINDFFDFLESKIKDIPEMIERFHSLRNNPETEQKIEALWSKQLFEKGLVPKGYSGLPDNLLISNLHQEGYLDGLYVGYILALMALVDNNAPNEIILAVRDYIRPNLFGHHYDDRDEFISQYKDEKYSWVAKAKSPLSEI